MIEQLEKKYANPIPKKDASKKRRVKGKEAIVEEIVDKVVKEIDDKVVQDIDDKVVKDIDDKEFAELQKKLFGKSKSN